MGAALGAAGAWYAGHAGRRGGPEQRYQRLLKRFSRKLDLTAGQRAEVAKILESKRRKMESLRAEARPRFEALRISTRAEIRALLTPEQQSRFDVLHEKWEARWGRRGGRSP